MQSNAKTFRVGRWTETVDIKIGTGTAPLSFVMVHVSQVSSAILMLCKRDTTSSYHSRYACAYAKDGEGQGLVKHTQSPRQTKGVEKGKYMTCNLGYLTRQLIEGTLWNA